MKLRLALILTTLLLVVASCGMFKPVGRELGDGLLESLNKQGPGAVDAILAQAGNTMRDSVLDARTRAQAEALIDGLMKRAQAGAASLRDSTLGPQLRVLISDIVYTALGDTTEMRLAKLRNQLLGKETQRLMAVLRDEMLGTDTRLLLADLRRELLGDSTTAAIGLLRDELLGPGTRDAVREIVDSAMAGVVRSYREDLSPGLRGDISFVQKNAVWLLVALGVIALVIVLVIWHKKSQVEKTLGVVTVQINEIPDKQSYDELTNRIQKKAQETGLEPVLRQQLVNQGLKRAA